MPPHINILFRARPPLDYMKAEGKKKTFNLDGLFNGFQDYLNRFETKADIYQPEIESTNEKRFMDIVEKTEINRLANNDKMKECK